MKFAFSMKLLPGSSQEYKKRHDAIWPEIKELLHSKGIKEDYYIYLEDSTNTLFAIQESIGDSSQNLGVEPIIQKWWDYMKDLMVVNVDNSPKVEILKEVFYMP